MSGVYIPGTAMPESCNLCFAEFDGDCLLNHDIICTCSPVTRSADCPLIPVPDHGDLIERDALVVAYDAEHVGPPGRARELMMEAPTVIPADKEAEA